MRRSEELDTLIALFAARMDVGGVRARDGTQAAEKMVVTFMQHLAAMGLFSGWRIVHLDPDLVMIEVNYGGAIVHLHEFPYSLLTPENAVAAEVMWE